MNDFYPPEPRLPVEREVEYSCTFVSHVEGSFPIYDDAAEYLTDDDVIEIISDLADINMMQFEVEDISWRLI